MEKETPTISQLCPEHNSWNAHIDKQKEICSVYHSKWNPINKKLKVGASTDLSIDPIHGLRHPAEKGTTIGLFGLANILRVKIFSN
jgi:hypothetical protein